MKSNPDKFAHIKPSDFDALKNGSLKLISTGNDLEGRRQGQDRPWVITGKTKVPDYYNVIT